MTTLHTQDDGFIQLSRDHCRNPGAAKSALSAADHDHDHLGDASTADPAQ
jgi:hypothetical protein